MTETFRERCSRIDGVIAEKYYAVALAAQQLAMAEHGLGYYGKRVKEAVSGHRTYSTKGYPSLEETFALLDEHTDRLPAYDARSIERSIERVSEADAWLRYCEAEYTEAASQYEGWTRAFLVRNGNGHIHSSMACSTCYPTTEFGWLTDLSGADEAEIIEHAKEVACTVCYPDAPVEKYKAEAAAAKAATRCAGTGRTDWDRKGKPAWGTRYAACPVCETTQAVTSGGKIRAHKPS